MPTRTELIWDDKKYVLPSLLPEFAGKVNLIYIDPPFDTGADFSFTAAIPDTDDEEESGLVFTKQPSIIEQKAYRDTWGRGIDSYLQWFYETAVLLHELLAENGSLYVHIGPGIGSYVRVLLEEIFGSNVPSAELCWKRVTTHGDSKRWGIIHDFIIWHAKSTEFSWNSQYEPYSAAYLGAKYTYSTEDGRKYRLDNMTA